MMPGQTTGQKMVDNYLVKSEMIARWTLELEP